NAEATEALISLRPGDRFRFPGGTRVWTVEPLTRPRPHAYPQVQCSTPDFADPFIEESPYVRVRRLSALPRRPPARDRRASHSLTTERDTMNKTTKHTPGPWTYDRAGRSDAMIGKTGWNPHDPAQCGHIIHGPQRAIARMMEGDNESTIEANARLIAAAPDLLRCVQAIDA